MDVCKEKNIPSLHPRQPEGTGPDAPEHPEEGDAIGVPQSRQHAGFVVELLQVTKKQPSLSAIIMHMCMYADIVCVCVCMYIGSGSAQATHHH